MRYLENIALLLKLRINHQIRATEIRVVDEEGANVGVMSLGEALRKAEERGVDLIEISPGTIPPVAKLMDYGKFQYLENKKLKKAKASTKHTELKTLQVKIATSEHDLELKARQAAKFLQEGHRVKVDLYLAGRAKYLDKAFLRTRLERLLHLIPEEYKIVQEIKPVMKGLTVMIEKGT